MRLLGQRCIQVEAIALDRHLLCVIAETAKFSVEIIPDGSFIAADGLDVHQLPSERNRIHGGENSRQQKALRLRTRTCGPQPADPSLRTPDLIASRHPFGNLET